MTAPQAVNDAARAQAADLSRVTPPDNVKWLPAAMRDKKKQMAIYVQEFLPLVASSSNQSATLLIDGDSYFVAYALAATIRTAANIIDTTQQPIQVFLRDLVAGVNLTFVPTDLSLMFGSQGVPLVLPAPLILLPNANLFIQLINLTATNWNVRLAFIGMRVYPNVALN